MPRRIQQVSYLIKRVDRFGQKKSEHTFAFKNGVQKNGSLPRG